MAKGVSPGAGFRNVLCAVDFSRDSRTALRYAAAVAASHSARLTVLYASDPMLLAAAAAGYNQQLLDKHAHRELASFARRSLPERQLARLSLDVEVCTGQPVTAIMKRAGESGIDLVVLGTRGLNGASKWLLGSTTAGVLRRTRVPVLTISATMARHSVAPDWPPRRLVGALALGPEGRKDAARYAASGRAIGAPVTLLHVVKTPVLPLWFETAAPALPDRDAAGRMLNRLLRRDPGTIDELLVLSGDPADGIAATAGQRPGSLVLMILRKGPGVLGPRPGTVAYELLCRGVAPILALPDR